MKPFQRGLNIVRREVKNFLWRLSTSSFPTKFLDPTGRIFVNDIHLSFCGCHDGGYCPRIGVEVTSNPGSFRELSNLYRHRREGALMRTSRIRCVSITTMLYGILMDFYADRDGGQEIAKKKFQSAFEEFCKVARIGFVAMILLFL